MSSIRRLLLLSAAAMAVAAPAVTAQTDVVKDLESIRQAAVAAYNSRDWEAAAERADAYVQRLDAAGLPHAGADFALVSFIGGHARLELWKKSPDTFKYDFERDVLGAMHASLDILQDDPFFKFNILGSAYYEKLKADGFRNLDYENKANWYLYKALISRAEELQGKPKDGDEYTAFAKFVLLYINRAFEMARHSPVPQVYLVRVREACRLGFGTKFDDRFNQLFQVVGFDDGNVRAGVLWQTGLDMMADPESDPDEVLDTFRKAAEATKGYRHRAEIYRQMADYASRLDEHKYKLQAVEYGRMAFRLDPENHDIQVQYGTSLHVISYANYNQGRYEEALKAAKEATSFEWDGDEVAYFDLSRAQANFGDKINALTNAEIAYEKAKRKYEGEELQPFRQNYVNILRQFGLSARADQIEAEGEGS
ncbi:MAG: hypothetical protein D6718_09845 [Acidobacteria bacterium]|nr:MAG: hypothetical protein D6718_09845 [Acidobacteriota bacterium]